MLFEMIRPKMMHLATRLGLIILTVVLANLLSMQRLAAAETCVFKDLAAGETCPVYSTANAVSFLDVGEDAVIFIESADQARTSVVASTRVEDAVLLEQIDEDEGLLLEREIQELSGARYEIPNSRREVKKQLGFPESAEIAAEDWPEMIRVHAETVLSVSPLASRFILEQAGLTGVATPATSVAPPITASAPSDPVVIKTH